VPKGRTTGKTLMKEEKRDKNVKSEGTDGGTGERKQSVATAGEKKRLHLKTMNPEEKSKCQMNSRTEKKDLLHQAGEQRARRMKERKTLSSTENERPLETLLRRPERKLRPAGNGNGKRKQTEDRKGAI